MSLTANQSIEKAAALLRAVADAPDGATPAALAEATGIPKPTVIRLLATMVSCGLLSRDSDAARYRVGHEFVRIARQADPHRTLIDRCRPSLERLVQETGETVTLSVPIPGHRLDTIFQIDSPQIVRDHDWVGRELPLNASSNGKVLLAELPDWELETLSLPRLTRKTITSLSTLRSHLAAVRKNGFALSLDEVEDGLSGMAVPVRDHAGDVIATLTVSGPSFRFSARARTRHLSRLRAAAAEVESKVGGPVERRRLAERPAARARS